MYIDYNLVTTSISIVALVITIIALVIETRSERKVLQTDILLNLASQLDSGQIRLARKNAAKNILKKKSVNDELSDVLGFLSTIAVLYERKAIDDQLTYKEFSYWMVGYWLCSQEYIKHERVIVHDLWGTLEKVVNTMLLIEKKAGYTPYTAVILDKFLHEEARLKIYA